MIPRLRFIRRCAILLALACAHLQAAPLSQKPRIQRLTPLLHSRTASISRSMASESLPATVNDNFSYSRSLSRIHHDGNRHPLATRPEDNFGDPLFARLEA